MKLAELQYVVAARDSWDHLFGDDPLRNYELHSKNAPEILEAHQRVVTAIIEENFDLEKACRRLSKGHLGFSDQFDSGKEHQKKLAAFLQKWVASHQ